MADLLKSKKLALMLPLLDLAYVAGLFYFQLEPASAYKPVVARVTNSVVWDAEFSEGQSLDGFPSDMRHHIRQGFYQWDDVIAGMHFDVDEAYSGEDAYVKSVSFYDIGYGNGPAVTQWTTSDGKASYSIVSMNSDWEQRLVVGRRFLRDRLG